MVKWTTQVGIWGLWLAMAYLMVTYPLINRTALVYDQTNSENMYATVSVLHHDKEWICFVQAITKSVRSLLIFAQDDPRKHECRGKMNQGEVPARERYTWEWRMGPRQWQSEIEIWWWTMMNHEILRHFWKNVSISEFLFIVDTCIVVVFWWVFTAYWVCDVWVESCQMGTIRNTMITGWYGSEIWVLSENRVYSQL